MGSNGDNDRALIADTDLSDECQTQCLVIYRGCHLTLVKTLRGSNNYKPRFTDEGRSSGRFGAWSNLAQVGVGRAWTWTPQSDLEST